MDPSIQLVSCGKEGYDSWDWIVLHELVDVVDYHSLHLYTKGSSHEMSVMGSAAAEKAIKMTMEVVDLARIAKGTSNRPKICFDEWSVRGWVCGSGGEADTDARSGGETGTCGIRRLRTARRVSY